LSRGFSDWQAEGGAAVQPRDPPGRGRRHAPRLVRTRGRFGLPPERLAADTAFGSGEMLGWLVDEQ
jgi:hypothetical protein